LGDRYRVSSFSFLPSTGSRRSRPVEVPRGRLVSGSDGRGALLFTGSSPLTATPFGSQRGPRQDFFQERPLNCHYQVFFFSLLVVSFWEEERASPLWLRSRHARSFFSSWPRSSLFTSPIMSPPGAQENRFFLGILLSLLARVGGSSSDEVEDLRGLLFSPALPTRHGGSLLTPLRQFF